MKRFGALMLAAALIVIAVVVRNRLDDNSSSGSNSDTSAAATVVCVTELDAVCRALDQRHTDLTVRIEDEATTQQTLVSASFDPSNPPFDAWVTLQPFPEMVAEQRSRALLPVALGDTSQPLARSPLVIAAWNDRRAALETACPGGITWKCIGDQAGRPWADVGGSAAWGSVKPSHSVPDVTASGLLVLAQASGSYFGRSDFARNDFDGDPGFGQWFEQLERSIPYVPRAASHASRRDALDRAVGVRSDRKSRGGRRPVDRPQPRQGPPLDPLPFPGVDR